MDAYGKNDRWLWVVGLLLGIQGIPGCGGADERTVVVYSAQDREFAEPILADYQARTGVSLPAKYDVESTKTVGLVNLIMAEANSPRCDVFWNNEILNTIRLENAGLLAPFQPANASRIAATFKSQSGTWYGFAARARILLVNKDQLKLEDRPRSIRDLIEPRFKRRIGLAKPLFGTTATHAACLFAVWGEQQAQDYYRALKANGIKVYSGNKQVAQAVSSGEIAVGMTDTDDAMGEIEAGQPVEIVYPDRDPQGLGTLFLPNTIAILKGAPHPHAAQALASALLSPEVESALAAGPSAQIPLIETQKIVTRVETPRSVHAMEVDFAAAARLWDKVAAFLAAEFTD